MEQKILKCPNCGANATNADNCEYCGSLLVRFVDKGIDLSKTSYLDDAETFPGLTNALKQNLQLQENINKTVVTDIVGPVTWNDVGRDYIGNVLRNGYACYLDGTPVPSKSKKGLSISFTFGLCMDEGQEKFNQIQEDKRKRFKSLDSYPLFTEHISYYTNNREKRKDYEYFIDFGEDAEGAARLLSKIWQEVYEIPLDANIEYYTNAGNDNVAKTRKAVAAELFGQETDEESGNTTWYYWVGAIIFILYWLLK